MSEKSEIIPSAGDTNLGPVLVGINWAVFGPSTVIVCLRIVTRMWVTHNIGWDDAVMALAQMVNAVGIGLVTMEVHFGLGRHVQYLPTGYYEGFLKYNYLDWIQVFIILGLTKISICLFLLRISKFDRWRWFLFGLIAFLVVSHTPLTLLFLLQCIPLNKNWNMQVPGHCLSKAAVEKIIIVQGVFSIVTDFICAAFPIVLLWNAKLKFKTKVALNSLMGLGVITGVVCIVRTSYSWSVLSNDITWAGVGNALARIFEVNFGILAACAPVMRPLYLYLHNRLGSSSRTRDSLPSTIRTPMSQLQWYNQQRDSKPWWRRMWRAPQPVDRPDGVPERRLEEQRPEAAKAAGRGWPGRRVEKGRAERPENVTWAKESELGMADSFDLPLQGTGSGQDDGSEKGGGEEDGSVFGTFRYNRGWV